MNTIEETLYRIVEEAVRKVLAVEKKKKVLLLLRDGTDKESFFFLLGELRKTYQVDVLSFLLKDLYLLEKEELHDLTVLRSSILMEESYEALLQKYEGMLLSEVSPEELTEYKDLSFKGAAGKLVYHTLKEDKPVYAFSYELCTMKNKVMKKRYEKILTDLSDLKLMVLPLLRRSIDTVKKEMRPSTPVQGEEKIHQESSQEAGIFREKFITLSDLLSLREERKVLTVRQDAVLTDAAEEYRKRRGMTLHRKNE